MNRMESAAEAIPADRVVRRLVVARGTVQGVGYRPLVYRRAVALGLAGTVRNAPCGVRIDVEGSPEAVFAFIAGLGDDLPKLAHVTAVEAEEAAPQGARGFAIAPSELEGERAALPPPDSAPCVECVADLRDEGGRRHRYPFVNCTACGPRLSILRALPYDRARTTMTGFALCEGCRREYDNPAGRRFHAEPNACARCGPRLTFDGGAGVTTTGEATIVACIAALRGGAIVAVKGVGGFQLACDARDASAVLRLRERKRREAKPLALLAATTSAVAAHAWVSDAERACLESAARPIVLLARRPGSDLAPSVAPGLAEVGFMLPPSPLHQLLADAFGGPLVMTSGNLADEPIARDDDEARRRLGAVADAFLGHNRAIVARLDNSVVRVERGVPRLHRRARGYVPGSLPLASPRAILAVGADLKSTFCLVAAGLAHVGQHLGGLSSPEARAAWVEALGSWSALLAFEPEVAACNLHPDHASTRFASSLGVPLVRVQHHHAHLAACLAEHGRDGPVVGVIFDGAGLGEDGAVWGGEILVADRRRATREAHLRYVRQPGGERRRARAVADGARPPRRRRRAPRGLRRARRLRRRAARARHAEGRRVAVDVERRAAVQRGRRPRGAPRRGPLRRAGGDGAHGRERRVGRALSVPHRGPGSGANRSAGRGAGARPGRARGPAGRRAGRPLPRHAGRRDGRGGGGRGARARPRYSGALGRLLPERAARGGLHARPRAARDRGAAPLALSPR